MEDPTGSLLAKYEIKKINQINDSALSMHHTAASRWEIDAELELDESDAETGQVIGHGYVHHVWTSPNISVDNKHFPASVLYVYKWLILSPERGWECGFTCNKVGLCNLGCYPASQVVFVIQTPCGTLRPDQIKNNTSKQPAFIPTGCSLAAANEFTHSLTHMLNNTQRHTHTHL